MSDTNQAQTPQAGAAANQSQADNSQAQAVAENQQTQIETISLEEARKLRSESANLRKRLKEAEAAEAELKKIKESELSEAEKLKAQLAEKDAAIAQAKQQARIARVKLTAQGAGYIPDAAERMIDWSAVEDTDDAIKAALEEAAKSYPWLKVQANGLTVNPQRAPVISIRSLTR
jgi:chromosome segregation ATPase